MKPLTRILAATDLSAPARHAVDRAFRIAAETGAGLDIAHVVSQSALDTLRRLLAAQASPVEQHILDDAHAKTFATGGGSQTNSQRISRNTSGCRSGAAHDSRPGRRHGCRPPCYGRARRGLPDPPAARHDCRTLAPAHPAAGSDGQADVP